MKPLFYIRALLFIMVASLCMVACEKDDDKKWGNVLVGFSIVDENALFAPAEVQFINNSKNAESYHWTFPEGQIMRQGNITQENETTDIQPERVFYPIPGDYEATLVIHADGEEKVYRKEFTVYKPMPKITHEPSFFVFEDTVVFHVEYFKYLDLQDQVTFSWDLGNGETSEEASPITTYPAPGEYTVTLELFDGVETLHAEKTVNVLDEIAKTLYITNAINQRLYTKRLYTNSDLPHENINVNVGLHPLSVTVHQDRVVVSVAGENIRFADAGTPADGYIFTTNLEGNDRWTITAPGPDHIYTDDPFVSTVGPDGTVYWVDRFQGGRKIHYTEQDADYPNPFVFHEASEGTPLANAIGVSTAYGWTDGAIRIVDGEIWYSKHGTGRGLYRFTLDGDYIDKFDNLFDLKIKTFEVDLDNGKIYFAVNNTAGGYSPGLYRCDIDGQNIELIDPLVGFSTQGGEAERTYVTAIVVDADGGYIYYPFRHEEDLDHLGNIVGDGSQSGVKRWRIDNTEEPEFYVTGLIPYGIGIDHVKR